MSVATAALAPGDPGYDAARAVWNRLHDRRPAVIVPCTSPEDVVAAGFTGALTEPMLDVLVERGALVGSPLSVIEVLAMGGAIHRVPDTATAFPHRGARWLINIPGQWADPADTAAEIAWVRDTYAALSPHLSGGAYANFMEGDEAGAAAAAYGPRLERLRAVKRAYDPENVFRLNQNIVP